MNFILLLILLSLPWLLPAIGFLIVLEGRGYSVWAGEAVLLATGFIGWTALAGQTALRTWMIWRSFVAPVVLWIFALVFLRRRETAAGKPEGSPIFPHVLILCAWGAWMGWNAFVLAGAVGVRGSQENADRGSLGSIRSGLEIYKADKKRLPARLEDIIPDGLSAIPELGPIAAEDRILHPKTRQVANFAAVTPNDAGGWGYVIAERLVDGRPNPDFGKVFINCTHLDLRGMKRLADY